MSESIEIPFPIRLIFGISQETDFQRHGFAVYYENEKGACRKINVIYEDDFRHVHFIEEGESHVVFQANRQINEKPVELVLKGIFIRRDWQFAGSKQAASAVGRKDGILLRS